MLEPNPDVEPLPEGTEVQAEDEELLVPVAWRRAMPSGRARAPVVRAASSKRDLENCILVMIDSVKTGLKDCEVGEKNDKSQ